MAQETENGLERDTHKDTKTTGQLPESQLVQEDPEKG